MLVARLCAPRSFPAACAACGQPYTGERVGRALVGMEFDTAEDRETIRKRMGAFSKNIIRSIREISPEAFQRIMGSRQLTGNH